MSRLFPLLAFVIVLVLLGFGLRWNTKHDPHSVPSPLINKPAPAFALPELATHGETISKRSLMGKPYLINVFASWCASCAVEQPLLTKWAKRLGITLIGYDYKDQPDAARIWLAQHGNPYQYVISDHGDRTALDFGIYGVPETYLIDAKGIIRYKKTGPLSPESLRQQLVPAIAALR